jgi:multidrug transporter EmrE-like cation transporter
MSARVEMMSTEMNHESSLQKKRLIDGLKIVLPTVILVAVGFAFLRRTNQTLLPVALDFATASAVGIAAGLTTRWSLTHRAGLLQALVALAMTISALMIVGLFTLGEAGLRMLTLRSEIDWNGLGQVMVGGACAFLALRAWRPTVSMASPPDEIMPAAQPPVVAPRRVPTHRVSRRRRERGLRLPRISLTRSQPAPSAQAASGNGLEAAHAIVTPRWRARILALPRFNFRTFLNRRLPSIKFTGAAEQRCPYCLDLIMRNDPRGIKACSICHTPHHADCWALAGACQVPHYHG